MGERPGPGGARSSALRGVARGRMRGSGHAGLSRSFCQTRSTGENRRHASLQPRYDGRGSGMTARLATQLTTGAFTPPARVTAPPRLTERHPWLYPLAVRVHQARRHLAWATSGTAGPAPGTRRPCLRAKRHRSLLLRELEGAEMGLQHNKVTNLRLASARVDGVLIRPGRDASRSTAWSAAAPAARGTSTACGSPTARRGPASVAGSASSPTCCTGCSCTRR